MPKYVSWVVQTLFVPTASDIPGQTGTTSYTATNAAGPSPLFYRVGVGNRGGAMSFEQKATRDAKTGNGKAEGDTDRFPHR